MKRHLSLLLFSLLACISLQAQAIYPVQVYTQLVPPYTPHVSAYYSGIQPKLRVTLINSDMQQPVLSVRLRMKISSSSFSLTTPEHIYTTPIELQAGMPVQLSLDDLAVYFRRENLRVSGGQSEFYRTQQLPDNFYRFHFEAFETMTGKQVSNGNIGFAQAMIAAGEPPILNMPAKGAVIKESNIPSIFFSWTPKHMNSVASAYGTEYRITLVEIYDKKVAPEAAFAYSREVYTETVRSASFIHSVTQPMLIPGLRYAWRVQAVAREGVDEVSIFKNDGYSPVSWFDYAADCKTVLTFGAVYEDGYANITWIETDALEYSVEYRKKGATKWYAGNITATGVCKLYNLQAGQEYEYRIGTRCTGLDSFEYTDAKAIQIPEKIENGPNCGLMPDVNLTNQTPAQTLQTGLPVLAGDFPVFITEVSGSGRFSGKGYVGVPYLKNAQIAVTFSNIVVNTDNRLISGYFETKYDEKNNMIFDVDDYLTGGAGVGDIRTGEERAAYTVDYAINPNIKAKPVKEDDAEFSLEESEEYVLSKSENGTYTFILTDGDGNEKTVETDELPATIADKSGNTYEINEKGEMKPVSGKSDITLNDEAKNVHRKEIGTIDFKESANSKYALDQFDDIYKKVTEYYLKYKLSDDDMEASAKFMLPGISDEVTAFIKDGGTAGTLNPEKVRFVTEKGKEYSSKYNETDKSWTITVLGSEANDGQQLYAVQDMGSGQYATLGKLNIFTYEPLERTVFLIPVNGAINGFTEESVANELNKIYGKIGIRWNVVIPDVDFDYTPLNGNTFNVTGSGLLSTLTDDMKAINEAFKTTGYYDMEGLYLFILGCQASDKNEVSDMGGDMPLGSQFGYLFPGATAHTIAHEIGHGAFNLEHPFSRPGRNAFDKYDLPDNLMDYAGGTRFAKIQWDQTRAPGHVIGLFQKDEDAMAHYIIDKTFYTETGCRAPSNPFDNGDGDMITNLLAEIFFAYSNCEKYSKTKFLKRSKNKDVVIGELTLWFSDLIVGAEKMANGGTYCINDMTINLLVKNSSKEEIDLTKRKISGNQKEAYLMIDNAIKITIQEENEKSSKIVTEHIDKAFNLLNKNYFEKSYSGGFSVREDNLNQNQRNVIKYFLETPEGYDFFKQFAKKGDVVMGKRFDKDGWFYEKFGIGLIIQTQLTNTLGSNVDTKGITENKEKKHFSVNLSKVGFGTGIEDIDILEALLHECFMHVQTYVDAMGINHNNLYKAAQNKKYEPHNHHIHFTQIISTFKGKGFKDLPKDEKLYENDNKIIGLKFWPITAFDILKKYTAGRVTDYKLQHHMMNFSGTQITISESTGKIEDKQ